VGRREPPAENLARQVGAPVAAPNRLELQLALENKKCDEQEVLCGGAQEGREASDDVIGYVFAINGQISSGDVYPSNALFRKMWTKLLKRRGDRGDPSTAMTPGWPCADDRSRQRVPRRRRARHQGREALTAGLRQETREGEKAFCSRLPAPKGFVHRNYLAK